MVIRAGVLGKYRVMWGSPGCRDKVFPQEWRIKCTRELRLEWNLLLVWIKGSKDEGLLLPVPMVRNLISSGV